MALEWIPIGMTYTEVDGDGTKEYRVPLQRKDHDYI